MAKLDQVIFSEDVQLGDVTDTFAQMAVVGPERRGAWSAALLERRRHGRARLSDRWPATANLPGRRGARRQLGDRHARRPTPASPGSTCTSSARRRERLRRALIAAGAAEVDADTAEAIRIEAGVPLFHRDMDEETIPLEAGIESRAISLTQGCYVGRKSSSACSTAVTAASRASSSDCGSRAIAVPPAGARDSRRRSRDRRGDQQHAVAGAAARRSRSATSTATSSSRARRWRRRRAGEVVDAAVRRDGRQS